LTPYGDESKNLIEDYITKLNVYGSAKKTGEGISVTEFLSDSADVLKK
jgi:hypothetical protein